MFGVEDVVNVFELFVNVDVLFVVFVNLVCDCVVLNGVVSIFCFLCVCVMCSLLFVCCFDV